MIKNARDEIRNLVDKITEAHNTNPDHYDDLYNRAKDIDSLTQAFAAQARDAAAQGNEDLGFFIAEGILNEVRGLKHMWETTVADNASRSVLHFLNGGGMGFDVVFYTEVGHTIHKHILPPFETPLLTREQTAMRSPDVLFERQLMKDRGFVIVMYDNDAPHPARVHWLYTQWFNRRGNLDDEVLIPYEPPNPPQGETHTYTVLLLSKLLPPDTDIINTIPNKTHFNVEEFMEREGLFKEAIRQFKVGPA